MPILEVKRVTKTFGGVCALKDVDLEINSGEILGIIGPNGAGKTTLFNVISGYYRPDSGSVIFKGEEITGLPPYKICEKGISRTFQLTRPFKELTVFENVLIGSLFKSKSFEEAREKAFEMLKLTGLFPKRNVLARDLNIIEHKRLELTRALATEPEVLLLDEVVAGLRPAEMEEVFSVIKKINDQGITVVIVEHVMKFVMSICERIVVLNYGELIAEGKPKEIAKNKEVIRAYLGEEYVA
ncbi:ABC transporter ATP-binding protein [Candidatus Bathyarchaeota archaeon]|nr:ABC transporter ATP-binding protein [Candidatus Bathyarchaeota archaeon]